MGFEPGTTGARMLEAYVNIAAKLKEISVASDTKTLEYEVETDPAIIEKRKQALIELQNSEDIAPGAFDELARQLEQTPLEAQESVAVVLATIVANPKKVTERSRIPTPAGMQHWQDTQLQQDFANKWAGSFDANGKFMPSKPGGMRDWIDEYAKRADVDDKLVDATYGALPKNVRKKLASAGDAPVYGDGTVDANGNAVTEYTVQTKRGAITKQVGKSNDARAKRILKRYMEQKGIDPYTGEFVPLMQTQLEHIVPKNIVGTNAEQVDNWILIGDAPNGFKGNKNPAQLSAELNKEVGTPAALIAFKDKYNKSLQKAGGKEQLIAKAGGEAATALAKNTPDTRQEYAATAANTYGANAKYLWQALGNPGSYTKYQYKGYDDNGEQNPPKSTMGKLDGDTSAWKGKLPDKPTSLALQAVARVADNPTKKEEVQSKIAELFASRGLSNEEAKAAFETGGQAAVQAKGTTRETDEATFTRGAKAEYKNQLAAKQTTFADEFAAYLQAELGDEFFKRYRK